MLLQNLLVSLISVTIWQSRGEKLCQKDSECAFKSIPSEIEDTKCLGSFSCTKANVLSQIEDVSKDITLTCGGSYSCFGATVKGNNIQSLGLYSMAFTNASIYGGTLICSGEKSCFGSHTTLYGNDSRAAIHCHGFNSCGNKTAQILGPIWESDDNNSSQKIVAKVTVDGYLAAQNAVFITHPNTSFVFDGGYAGDGSKIICGKDAHCVVECFGNSCNDLNVSCEGTNIAYTNDWSIVYNENNECNITAQCSDADPGYFCGSSHSEKGRMPMPLSYAIYFSDKNGSTSTYNDNNNNNNVSVSDSDAPCFPWPCPTKRPTDSPTTKSQKGRILAGNLNAREYENMAMVKVENTTATSNYGNSWLACDNEINDIIGEENLFTLNCDNYTVIGFGSNSGKCFANESSMYTEKVETVCCSAQQACINDTFIEIENVTAKFNNTPTTIKSIKYSIINTNMIDYNKVGIRCDGGYSCNQVSTDYINNRINGSFKLDIPSQHDLKKYYNFNDYIGNVYFTGIGNHNNNTGCIYTINEDVDIGNRNSFKASKWNNISSIETTSNFDIFCTGEVSCQCVRNILNGRNLLCLGIYSCMNVKLISNISDSVYAFARGAAMFSTFSNIGGNVSCAAKDSCSDAKFNSIGGSIFGISNYSLAFTTINNVKNSVVAVNPYALYYSQLENVTQVSCVYSTSIKMCFSFFLFFVCWQIAKNDTNTIAKQFAQNWNMCRFTRGLKCLV